MPVPPPAPNPAPPKDCGSDGVVNIEATRLAMHRWAYPLHYDCSHYRGFTTNKPSRCPGCVNSDKRARKYIAGHIALILIQLALALLILGSHHG